MYQYEYESKLTKNQELSLALILWKAFRQKAYSVKGDKCRKNKHGVDSMAVVVAFNADVAEKAIKYAEAVGCKEEFLNLMMEMPIIKVQFLELEPWTKSPLSEEFSEATSPPPKKPRKRSSGLKKTLPPQKVKPE